MLGHTLPIFVAGIGSALEVYPVPLLYPIRRHFDGLTDAQLLASDWYRVGHALYSAMGSAGAENAVGEEQETTASR